ncbi:MAG TPA: response regulator transcription factor [Urbifossiella sp.]|jgi:two-component system OmpR family response regulator/two-component system copper resistance phosphate regulon response regulator CusR|nr:response regulator transcription factor [Urbifossiella sp.]
MELLVVEDDPVIGRSLRQGFVEAGDKCVWAKEGDHGLELARSQQFEAIVLDVLLPKLDGLEVVRTLRTEGVKTPVILLTALGSVEERVAGLKAGADDYLVKPFAFAELKARLEAIGRRLGPRASPTLQVGSLNLDLSTRRVARGDRDIDLTPTEFSLLEFLMRHDGQVVTRKMLCEHLWESDWEGSTNVIEVHVNRLRGKLDRGFDQSIIQTVRGRGYAIREA